MNEAQADADRAFRRYQQRVRKYARSGARLSFDQWDRRLWEAGRRYGLKQRACCERKEKP